LWSEMKVVILAGGLGTRLSEETQLRPKPMVELGGRPIIWHLMKYFAEFGHSDFIICCGYRGDVIKQFFVDFVHNSTDICVDLGESTVTPLYPSMDNWRVTLVDTGASTMTGGRLKRIQKLLPFGEPFFMTYGDGLANVDLDALLAFHTSKGLLATVTSVGEPGRFGEILSREGVVTEFVEKPEGARRINGGFFLLDPSTLDLVENDGTVWEREPMESLARAGQLAAFQHNGFWQPMDTLRDRMLLESLLETNAAPWKTWSK
jgi:glucose-1-phosphate cytidylyltransferase